LNTRINLPALADALRYFSKRLEQMRYPLFQAEGWPIGSGMVESANKAVVQQRLKGAGMHWAPENVNPMVALRTAVCTDRWSEAWSQQEQYRSDARLQRRQQRGERRRALMLQHLITQLVRLCLLCPRQDPPTKPAVPKGRTGAQKRWGRQTFSPKALHLRHAKI
jgi:hypothetical protein